MAGQHRIRVGRVYDARARGDGARVLVDRLWPRGLSRERADIDEWLRDVAPSSALRTWYGHDPDLVAPFAERYRAELEEPERAEAVERLRELARRRTVTLLTATAHLELSHAQVLAELLTGPSDGEEAGATGSRPG
jgi:uncharacterized protein YeaO (DUF488 family)